MVGPVCAAATIRQLRLTQSVQTRFSSICWSISSTRDRIRSRSSRSAAAPLPAIRHRPAAPRRLELPGEAAFSSETPGVLGAQPVDHADEQLHGFSSRRSMGSRSIDRVATGLATDMPSATLASRRTVRRSCSRKSADPPCYHAARPHAWSERGATIVRHRSLHFVVGERAVGARKVRRSDRLTRPSERPCPDSDRTRRSRQASKAPTNG